jgi:pyruvyltransferase
MKTINSYWCNHIDGRFVNYGDVLAPFIFKKHNIKLVHTDYEHSQVCTMGSLLHVMPKDYKGYIWSLGFMYPTHTLHLEKDPICVRGKLSLRQFKNDTSNTVLGDGGLLVERVYNPDVKKQYKLGIFANYCDIQNNDEFENYKIFKNPDVLLIDPRNYVETVIRDIKKCHNIISSSLHGLISCDSFGINHNIFSARETKLAIHQLQDSFKFKDYYSIYGIEFQKPTLYLDNNTSIEQCLSICRPVLKPNLECIKERLDMSIETIKGLL